MAKGHQAVHINKRDMPQKVWWGGERGGGIGGAIREREVAGEGRCIWRGLLQAALG